MKMRNIKFELEAILGIELVRCPQEITSEQMFELEIVEGSAINNQDETISIEKLDSSELEDIYYVTIKVNGTWEMEGYYQAI